MKQSIIVNGKTYDLVKIQTGDSTAIYKHADEYLRIGDKEKINKNLKTHRDMESVGFPVAHIIDEGKIEEVNYFIESSLGDKELSTYFAEDVHMKGKINDKHFEIFLTITEGVARAQLKTISKRNTNDFINGVCLERVCNELPEYADIIREKFTEIVTRLSVFPFVLTHGDFNAHNIYPEGIIDFMDSFYGPFGYDLIGALVHIDYFPASHDYEYFAGYSFTDEQIQEYGSRIDLISEQAGFAKLSLYKNDFEFCKALWLLPGLQKWPKLQQYRYDLFTQRFLK